MECVHLYMPSIVEVDQVTHGQPGRHSEPRTVTLLAAYTYTIRITVLGAIQWAPQLAVWNQGNWGDLCV